MEYILKNGKTILIDSSDIYLMYQYNWQSNRGYIFRTKQENGKMIRYYLHREIMNPPEEMVVDHINGNPSDNRRRNLRICTIEENNRNRRKTHRETLSIYKGVTPREGKFEASCKVSRNYIYIGTFKTEIEAAIAYNEEVKKHFGEFANLNSIPEKHKNVIPEWIKFTSSYRGVAFHKRNKKWQASIQHEKKRYYIGYFECEHEAARQYNKKAKKLKGEGAKLNKINE